MAEGGDSLQELIAEEVRAQLGRARMSARQLAGQLGMSPMYVSRRLSGQIPFTVADLEEIARILRVPVTRFFPRSDDGFPFSAPGVITRTEFSRLLPLAA